jgi:polyhydroxyalkanoate synthesis regulator phasin
MATTTFNPTGSQAHSGGNQGGQGKDSGHGHQGGHQGGQGGQGGQGAGKQGGAMEQAKEKGKEVLDKGSDMLDKAKDMGTDALNRAKEAAGNVGTMATDTMTNVGKTADDWAKEGGHAIRQLGDRLDKQGGEGFTGTAAHAVADTLRTSGQYLEEHKLSGMAQDVVTMVKNHPVPAMLVCLGLGICIGRAMKD